MIYYINLQTRDGKSLFFRNYGISDVDSDFLADFSDNFSEFVKGSSQSDIRSTNTDRFRYFYTIIDGIFLIVCTDLDEDDAKISSKITTIRRKFVERYGAILSNGNWLKDRDIFKSFGKIIDDIILGAIKVAIIGKGGVGKTELLHLICGKDIDLEYVPTLNIDVTSYDGFEDISRSIVFWDFAGQSNFRSLWKDLLDTIDIALLVLDSTFENVNRSKDMMRDLFNELNKDCLVIGIANYQDMPNRLSPRLIERILSESGWNPPIRVHGIDTGNPVYREKILAILKDAIKRFL